jgi:phosphoribosylanthranilate isomerase
MVKVKICGLTNLEDALVAAEAGADALGFVLYPKSPRCVKADAVEEIIQQLPPYVTTIGVFANVGFKEIMNIMRGCGLDLAQLQGDEPPSVCRRLGSKAVKAIRVKDRDSLSLMKSYSVRAFVLDTYTTENLGGTGKRFDWDLAVEAKQYGRIILAGGLNPENVGEAIRKVRPYGVDVSSGVEERIGKKDPEKVRQFVARAKES